MPPVEPEVGRDIGGYRIEKFIARGGMGAVYVAQQLRLERNVALKVIAPELAQDPAFRERFERESRIAASIDHPNVVPIYEAGEADGLLYIAMRLVPGSDLKTAIGGRGRLDPGYAVDITCQVAGALDAAHARGLVHRDIKPGNILLEPGPDGDRAYLSDFGLTKRMSSGSVLTGTGVVVGTLDYIAPEQLQGGAIDARSDVYALACLLFHALTGHVPYPRGDDMAKMYAHAHLEPPDLLAEAPHVPAGLADVITRGMAKSASDRYLSAGDLGRAAAAAVRGTAPPSAEQSVARGAAAPQTVVAPTATGTIVRERSPQPVQPPHVPAGAAAQGQEASTNVLTPRRARWPVFAVAALTVLVLGLAAALLVTSTRDDDPAPTTAATSGQDSDAGRDATTTEPAEETPTSDGSDDPVKTLPREGGEPAARFESYRPDAGGYEVLIPTGGGWAPPTEQWKNPGLHEARVNGPGGLTLLINYTPAEAATVSPASSCEPTDHAEFSQARKCVFSGGALPECQNARCVDFLLNDGAGGPGYAVLVAGDDADEADATATRVAESLTPSG